jgi:thioredoxin-dependent peroxiredoxin
MSAIPEPGSAITDVAMLTPDGGSVRPSDFAGQKLVLFFYPKDDTPGCTTENQDFSALADDFAKAGTALLGISKDPPARHAKFTAKYGLKAPLASDPEIAGLSDALGFWAEKQMYGKSYMGMVRSTVLVGTDGKIAQVWSPVKVKGHAAEVLAAAQAL